MWVYKGVEVRQWRMIISILTRIDTVDAERVNSIEDFSASPIPNPPKLLPVGTKVRVFEGFDSYHSKDEFVIESIYIGNYNVKWDACRMIVPARAVYPVWEE